MCVPVCEEYGVHACLCVCGEHVCVSMSLGGVNMHVCDCEHVCERVCLGV